MTGLISTRMRGNERKTDSDDEWSSLFVFEIFVDSILARFRPASVDGDLTRRDSFKLCRVWIGGRELLPTIRSRDEVLNAWAKEGRDCGICEDAIVLEDMMVKK